MKRVWIGWMILLMIGLLTGYASACSGFVVYSNETMYGMNYDDSPEMEMNFTIQQEGTMKYFLLYFESGGRVCTVNGMNQYGCFMTLQMAPAVKTGKSKKPTMILPEAVLSYLRNGTSLDFIQALAKENHLINPSGWSLHSLVADSTGRAMILETGPTDTVMIPNTDHFLVMTNFKNADFIGVDYQKIKAPSAKRYQSIMKALTTKMGHFNLDTGLSMLKGAAQSITKASMIFYPKKGEIYLTMHRNYSRVWKISLGNATIETYKGFRIQRKVALNSDGLTETELSQWK